jgi:aminoglycoside phosphotransferase (APT) family kinase protein
MTYGALKQKLSRQELNALIRAALGSRAKILQVQVCRGGLFNTTYRLALSDARTVVLRIAPPDGVPLMGVERDLMRREVAVAKWMRKAQLSGPQILHTDFSRRTLDRDWVVATCEPGSNWHYRIARLSDRENDALSSQLGAMAKKIHATVNPDGWFGYPRPFRPHKTWSSFVLAYAASLEKDQGALVLPPELSPVALATRLAPVLDEIREPRLVHGDLWARNILFEDGRITAVLDCDRGLWGDPRFEWVLYGYPFRDAFWSAYGPKELRGRSARLRNLLYRGCGAFQAAIEEWVHFRHRTKAQVMLGYAVKDLGSLRSEL